jgi:basic membrane lipoprotein Med (substrate-binding protein (PBP1-ABC) superfamily)
MEVDFKRKSDGKLITPQDKEDYAKVIAGWSTVCGPGDVASVNELANGSGSYPEVHFNAGGARKMQAWSELNNRTGEEMAVVVDGVCIELAPLKDGAVVTDEMLIGGNSSPSYVKDLVRLLNSGDPKAEPAAAQPADFKVALLTPGSVSDSGWSALAFQGLEAIRTQMGAETNNEVATGTQIKDSLRSYAQKGYSLVFGHGYEYNEPSIDVAKDFPKTVFVSSSGGKTAPNVGAFRFYLEQGFYLAGMMAAEMSKTGKLALIGGDDVPSIRSTFMGFEAGAKAANPKVQFKMVFTGNGDDVAKAKLATLQAIGEGADFVIHQCNAAAQGVFDACKEKGVYAFGANLNQNDNPSGVVCASAIIVAKPAFLDVAKQVKDGTFKGAIILKGMDSGAIDFVLNPSFVSKIPDKVQKDLTTAMADIKSGKLVVPKDEF